MVHYRCYILRLDQSISSRHDIEVADDAEAMLKASQVATLSEEVPTIDGSTRATEKIQRASGPDRGLLEENGE
jgi:hypothetical protein